MRHADAKTRREQKRMVRRLASDFALQQLYAEKKEREKAEAYRKRKFEQLLLERWQARHAEADGHE